MNEKALKYLYGLLKDTRIALGNAERKPNVDPAELDNLRSKIDMLEYSAAAVLAYDEPKHGEWVEGLCSACGVEAECTIIEEPVYDYDWEENLRFSHFETKRIHHETKFCPNCGAIMDGVKPLPEPPNNDGGDSK